MLVSAAAFLCSLGANIVEASNGKTIMLIFYSNWCFPLCEDTLALGRALKNEIRNGVQRNDLDVIEVDCSSVSKSFLCCQHNVQAYPTVHISPRGSTSFWIFQGERSIDQMRYALLDDKSPKSMQTPLSNAGRLSCGARALKYSITYALTRTIGGSAVLGVIIGTLAVYIFIAMKNIKFGSRRGDFLILTGTLFGVYWISS